MLEQPYEWSDQLSEGSGTSGCIKTGRGLHRPAAQRQVGEGQPQRTRRTQRQQQGVAQRRLRHRAQLGLQQGSTRGGGDGTIEK